MNVLFLTMNVFTDIEMHNIYSDLMKEFIKHGYRPYIVTPREKKLGEKTELINYDDYSLLKVQIGNTSDVSLIEKGVSTVTLGSRFYNAVKEKLGKLSFGLVLYSTPPITLATPVKRLKKLFGCRTYLMLKDIFPQNAVDLGMFSENGLIYCYFRAQEKKLYKVSDKIGCMSPANVEYVVKNNPEIDVKKVEICPNSICPIDLSVDDQTRDEIRRKYEIPLDKKVFVYGGNLGKPQGIDFMIECLKSQEKNKDVFFLAVGDGTEFGKIKAYVDSDKPANVKLMKRLPKEDYDKMVGACDVGMIFLDHRFTIPNFPSRLLSYMQAKIPVLVCTDPNTDIGNVCVNNDFGWWCESNQVKAFHKVVEEAVRSDLKSMGENGFKYLEDNYSSETAYQIIMRYFK